MTSPSAEGQTAARPASSTPSTTVLVTGASGFVGSRLSAALDAAGHEVRAMTRHPQSYRGAGQAVGADVSEPESLTEPMAGVKVAYYLVHSLGSEDFERKDAEAAEAFGRAAAQAGVEQIIYLGGLGEDGAGLSAHLRSRREVESLLGAGGVPVTVLRAAVVIGHGGISWEITRQLVRHLPLMVAPRWVNTRTQPIALDDVIRYLVGVMGRAEAIGQTFEIGGPQVLSYADMLHRAAILQNQRWLPVVALPLLTPGLSSRWIALVTDVDVPTARHLIDSMTNEVVVHDHAIEAVVPGETITFDEDVRQALAERESAAGAAQA